MKNQAKWMSQNKMVTTATTTTTNDDDDDDDDDDDLCPNFQRNFDNLTSSFERSHHGLNYTVSFFSLNTERNIKKRTVSLQNENVFAKRTIYVAFLILINDHKSSTQNFPLCSHHQNRKRWLHLSFLLIMVTILGRLKI